MSNNAGPKIARDPSLILNIDAANYKSYPASQDPYVNSVSLMLDGESLTDKSLNNLTITNNGASISTSQIKFGSNSLYISGSSVYISMPTSTNFAFGTGDYTIECWLYMTTTSGQQTLFVSGTGSNVGNFAAYFNAGSTLDIYNNGIGPAKFSGSCVISANTWFHFAVTRSSGTVRVFINGTLQSSATDTYSYTSTSGTARIGNDGLGGFNLNAYIDDFRITKGYARYTANFTPPNSPLSLPNTSIDLTKNKSIGTLSNSTFNSLNGGSIVFNGTNSVLTYPSNTSYSFGTGDFTLESFCQVNLLTNSRPLAQNDAVGSSQNDKWWWAYDATAAGLRLGRHFTSTYSSCSWSPVSGQWYHVATTRVSGLMYFYINGVSQSVTNQTSLSGVSFSQNGISVGGMSTPYYLNGNISIFKMYNRGLTATEVYNNYIANRGRFGI